MELLTQSAAGASLEWSVKSSTVAIGVFLIPLSVSVGAGVLLYERMYTVTSYEKVDLAENQTGHSSYVEVSGVVRGDWQLTVAGNIGRDRAYNYYAPVTSPDWNRRIPVTYFVKSFGYTSKHDFGTYQTVEQGFLQRLSQSDVDRFVSKGLILSDSPVIINTDRNDELLVPIFSLIFGVPFSLLTGAVALTTYRSERRAAANVKITGR